MAPRTVYGNLADGLQNLSLWDQSLADMGNLGIIPCTATGTNAVTLIALPSAFAPTVASPPQQLQAFSFVAAATSTNSITVNGLKLYKEDGATQAAANDLLLGVLYGVVYNSALNGAVGGYQIVFPITSIISPVISGATISGSTITTSTYNGNTWTAGTGTLTIAAGKTLTASNSLALAGTDGTTMTFPTTSASIARTDTGQTFTGTNAFGVLTATTVNGNTFTAGTYTLTGVAAKTLTFNNSLTLAGTDTTTMTFPATSGAVQTADSVGIFTNKTFDTAGTGNVFKINGTAISAVIGTGAAVLAISPALTTPSLGVATATSINGAALDNTAWSTYTPTVTAGSGTFTTTSAAGRSKTIGKIVHVQISVAITTVGTAASTLIATLPTASVTGATYVLSGAETILTGKAVKGFISSGASTVVMTFYDNTFPGASGNTVVLTGIYEIP